MLLRIIVFLGVECSLQKIANTLQVTSFLNVFITHTVFLLLYFSPVVLLAALHGDLTLHHYEVCLFLANILVCTVF